MNDINYVFVGLWKNDIKLKNIYILYIYLKMEPLQFTNLKRSKIWFHNLLKFEKENIVKF